MMHVTVLILVSFVMWAIPRRLLGMSTTPYDAWRGLVGWLAQGSTAGFLVGLGALFQMGASVAVFIVFIVIYAKKLKEPFDRCLKPAWYLQTLSVMCVVSLLVHHFSLLAMETH